MTRSRVPPAAVVAAVIVVVAVIGVGIVAARSGARERGVAGGPAGTFVALGDSVPAGSSCGCVAYPELIRVAASVARGGDAYLLNAAGGGLTSGDVLAAVRDDDRAVVTALRRATTVFVTVGANDFGDDPAATCPAGGACDRRVADAVQRNVTDVLARIAQLSSGHARVFVTGYWGVFVDGAVAADRGTEFVTAARAVTLLANDALRAAATAGGATYVDLDAAFTSAAGPGNDRTSLLAADGDHPNAAGHRVIADALLAVCACA